MTPRPPFERWLPLGRQIARRSLRLVPRDVLEIYCYPPAIPLAEAIALEARRIGSDTHITLMSDDLWFTSMEFLPRSWLEAPSPAERAISTVATASVYVGGLGDAAKLQRVPDAKLRANGVGGTKQDAPRQKRRGFRHLAIPIGWVSEGRASVYGLDLRRWRAGFEAALDVDLPAVASAGARLARRYARPRALRIRGVGTDLRLRTTGATFVEDGMIGPDDAARRMQEALLPAGRLAVGVEPRSASGTIRFRDPLYQRGFVIRDVRLDVQAGRIVSWSSRTERARLDAMMRGMSDSARRIGWFSIGLNPAAPMCLMDNSIVQGAIAVGIGSHPGLSGKGGSPFDALGTVVADGVVADSPRA